MIIPVIIGYTGIVTEGLKKNLEAKAGNIQGFSKEDSYIRNITHNTENTAVWNLKPERWRSLLVQEKYRERKGCEKRQRTTDSNNRVDDDDDDNNNNNNNNKVLTLLNVCPAVYILIK